MRRVLGEEERVACKNMSCDVSTGKCSCSGASGSSSGVKVPAAPVPFAPPFSGVSTQQFALGVSRRGRQLWAAKRQSIMAASGWVSSVARSDPIELRGDDRFDGLLVVYYSFGATNRRLQVKLEGSDNLGDWVAFHDYAYTVVPSGQVYLGPVTFTYKYLRVVFDYSGDDASSFSCFDLCARVDES